MHTTALDFLKQLLSTPGPSGDEAAAARLWRAYAGEFADRVAERLVLLGERVTDHLWSLAAR